MLAIALALARDTKLLLLDEPHEGPAPVIVEQNALRALALADCSVNLDTGQVVFDGTAQEVLGNEALREEYLAI